MKSSFCILLVMIAASAFADCPPCTSTQCMITACSESFPFMCASGTAAGGCSSSPWTDDGVCTSCCNYMSCILECSATCSSTDCTTCNPSSSQTMCIAGSDAGQCGGWNTWSVADGCTACCNISACGSGPAPSPTTPAPGPTLPPTPSPSSAGLVCTAPCDEATCGTYWCSSSTPFFCLGGSDFSQCTASADSWGTQCTSCCDITLCGQTPSPSNPTPSPPTPSPPTAAPSTPTPSTPTPSSAPTTSSPSGGCPACTSSFCQSSVVCSSEAPYQCISGSAANGCSAEPWSQPACDSCCDTAACSGTTTPTPNTTTSPTTSAAPSTSAPTTSAPTTSAPTTSVPPSASPTTTTTTAAPTTPSPPTTAAPPGICPNCTVQYCQTEATCPPSYPYECVSGSSVGGCSATPWDTAACTDCCSVLSCIVTPAPTTSAPPTPSTPLPTLSPNATVTNPPILTPVPGWTNSPTDFPPQTPIPPSPPSTPTPSGSCPMCTESDCSMQGFVCSNAAPFLCLTGSAAKGCDTQPWDEAGCTSCCDYNSCLPTSTPMPSTPWGLIKPTKNCTLNGTIAYAPNPAATPYGGIDVSPFGCRAYVSEDCCGMTPRFNWILSTCNPDPSKRLSMACNHTNASSSAAEIYYINAYQWNTDEDRWVLDPISSVHGEREGDLVNFSALNMTITDNGYKQDWDLKYGPTTAAQGTDGLGPPAMMFVISAKQFTWSSFYILNQITLNRGPGAEHYQDNCWSSSAGELDLLEPPFWAGIELPADRLYLTITANAGRCFPVQKMVGSRFQKECNDPYCCQMCSCTPGNMCTGNTEFAGYHAMACQSPTEPVPSGKQAFTLDGDTTACGDYFGGVSGGADSTAYFAHHPENNITDVVFAAVIDGDGVTVMRWSTADSSSEQIWPGIRKYSAERTLQKNPEVPISPRPPCEDFNTPCAVYEPSCDDECVILSASGVFGLDQTPGPYSAESARDGLNWWNLFVSTNQTPGMQSNQLPMYVNVPVHPVPLPFSCDQSCGPEMCHEANRCPVSSPYMCTAGDGLNGCSNVSTFWPLSPHCNGCCDVVYCEVPCLQNCTAAQCDANPCNVASTPYYCTAGTQQGQCNENATYFPEQAGCLSCCDVGNCPQV